MRVKRKPGPVVGGEDHQRLSVDAQFLQGFQDPAHPLVNLLDHVAVETAPAFAQVLLPGVERDVRQAVGEIQKERLIVALPDVVHRFAGVAGSQRVLVGRSFHHVRVFDDGNVKLLNRRDVIRIPGGLLPVVGKSLLSIHVVGVGNAPVGIEAVVDGQIFR